MTPPPKDNKPRQSTTQAEVFKPSRDHILGILILSAQPGSRPWGVDARGVPLSS